jgi:hypothetical protein
MKLLLWSAPLVLGLASIPAVNYYYHASWGEGCAKCHEIAGNRDSWHGASHRNVNCTSCHSSSLAGNLRRAYKHVLYDAPEGIRLRTEDVSMIVERCRTCHNQEFARWKSGPHSATYARLLTNQDHNKKRLLMDDCLRCHGMHFEGSIRDAVEPVSTKGPWRIRDAALANEPAIPCLGCHSIHRNGAPLNKPEPRLGKTQELIRPSVAFYDRRTETNISAALLPIPTMLDGTRTVKMSADHRQALCYQCHAPLASMQIATGDDRTPIGVHEGLSCMACHEKHGQDTRASCANCHPRLSNCKLDVEKMDTTFASRTSPHDIHRVKCADCHPKGIPQKR